MVIQQQVELEDKNERGICILVKDELEDIKTPICFLTTTW